MIGLLKKLGLQETEHLLLGPWLVVGNWSQPLGGLITSINDSSGPWDTMVAVENIIYTKHGLDNSPSLKGTCRWAHRGDEDLCRMVWKKWRQKGPSGSFLEERLGVVSEWV